MVTRLLLLSVIFASKRTILLPLLSLSSLRRTLSFLFPVIELHLSHLTLSPPLSAFTCVSRLLFLPFL